MIDFHTHILPGIDDGSGSAEESLALLADLKSQGVDTVLLTPHYYGRQRSIPSFLSKREEAFCALQKAYRGDIRLVKACEYNVVMDANSDRSAAAALVIEGTQYILTELSFGATWGGEVFDRLEELKSFGLVPVIAHAELYPAVRKSPELVARLILGGCLIQINCDSVAEEDALALALLDARQVHCLGSDAHNTSSRPPHYAAAVQKIRARLGDGAADEIFGCMRDILQGRKVEAVCTRAVKRTLFGKYR